MKHAALWVGCLVLVLTSSVARAQLAGATLVKAQLLTSTDAVVQGQTFEVGVLLTIEPKWHVYWSNPGDSGQATTIKWTLPEGFTARPTNYPIPTQFSQPGDLAGYGYEREVFFTTTVTAPDNLPTGTDVSVSADVRWLVCEQVCIPGKAKLQLTLPVRASSSPTHGVLFESAERQRPVDLQNSQVVSTLTSSFDPVTSTTTLSFTTVEPVPASAITFFPGANDAIEVQDVKIDGDGLKHSVRVVMKKVDADGADAPSLDSLIVVTRAGMDRVGVNVAVPLK